MEAVVVGVSERLKRTVLHIQEFTMLSYRGFVNLLTPPRYWQDTFDQMDIIGVGSLTIVGLTGLFTGMVLTVQSSATLDAFGARPYVGRMVSISMIRDLSFLQCLLPVTRGIIKLCPAMVPRSLLASIKSRPPAPYNPSHPTG